MRGLIKTTVRAILVPIVRLFIPLLENLKRMAAYLKLSACVQYPVDTSVVVMGTAEVRGTGDIRFGKNLLLYPGLYLETADGGSIDIGDNVVCSRGVHIVSYSRVSIGTGSMIGEYTSIRDANHLRDANGAMRDGAHLASPITIGTQVWVGRGVTILPGVNVGNNATIGANAVVTRDVPAGVTVVGVPAVPIRAARPQVVPDEASYKTV
jgi:acetyltransferase-like isoleucine patch superfamily enzyme